MANYSRKVTDFKNSESRPSMQDGGDLLQMYVSGGSLYTDGHRPGPGGTGRSLDDQISKGVNFFGYGRNQTGSTSWSGGAGSFDETQRNTHVRNVAGTGPSTGKKGDYSMISGFTPGKKQMDSSDFGGDVGGIATVADSSWYTSGLKGVTRYGVSGAHASNSIASAADSTRHSGARSTSDR